MELKQIYSNEDKFNWWGDGEWVKEPDEVHFKHQGIQCKILRIAIEEPFSKEFHMFGGYLCGYVGIPSNHQWYQKKYEDIGIDVHGGLTFGECSVGHWIGFDCGHSTDLIPSMQYVRVKYNKTLPYPDDLPEKFKNLLIFNPTYKNMEFCVKECISMADQILEIQNSQ